MAEDEQIDVAKDIGERLALPPEIDAMLASLHRTVDAIAPALRVEQERRYLQSVGGAAVKLNFFFLGALLLLLAANLLLGWYATHPLREYFAADNGRIFPLVPMSQPYRKPADVIQYAKDTVNASFTLDFLNFHQQLEDLRARYTRQGFGSFLESLKQSGVLDAVRDRRMNMSISAGTGVLVWEGLDHGSYAWRIQLPIEVRLAGQTSELPPQRFLTTVQVRRIPTLDAIEGIGVDRLVTTPQ